MVISIFKRQRFRLLDRDHSRIGFAGNDRHGAFMMVSRPRRADRACTLCPCPEGHAAVAPPSSVMSSRRFNWRREISYLIARTPPLRIGSPAMGRGRRWRLGGLGGRGCGGLTAAWGSPLRYGRPGGGVGGYDRTTRFRSQRRGCGLTHSVETRRWPARPDLNRQKRSGRIPGSGQWQHGGRVI